MDTTHTIHCSNCGSVGTRRHFKSNDVIHSFCPNGLVVQTECPFCDYLMVMCSLTGSVIEAYNSATSAKTRNINSGITSSAGKLKTVSLTKQLSA